jgi:hypothetical protein
MEKQQSRGISHEMKGLCTSGKGVLAVSSLHRTVEKHHPLPNHPLRLVAWMPGAITAELLVDRNSWQA